MCGKRVCPAGNLLVFLLLYWVMDDGSSIGLLYVNTRWVRVCAQHTLHVFHLKTKQFGLFSLRRSTAWRLFSRCLHSNLHPAGCEQKGWAHTVIFRCIKKHTAFIYSQARSKWQQTLFSLCNKHINIRSGRSPKLQKHKS